jgi:phenylalanyl-tRNA synthetase beta chain
VLISLSWLRELVPVEAEAEAIARALTSRGLTVDAVVNVGDDVVFDLDVPANRPDALGHLGVAREVSAAFGVALVGRAARVTTTGAPVEEAVRVRVDAPDLCGRYTAGLVRSVRVGASPARVVARLESVGLRSVNNVVDVSNLVMLELGQPVHFFDLARLAGPAIVVRRAHTGEALTTLDGLSRSVSPEMLVIADADRPAAVAGVLGGAESEIRDATRDVLIEAAWFLPASIRATAHALGIVTEASQRFVRGCDPEAPVQAQALASRLLAEIASGHPAPGMIDVRAAATARTHVSVRLDRAATLLGFAPSHDEATAALAAVGLEPRGDGGTIEVTVPSWRVDLAREADLVEEIGRHLGYDRVPSRTPTTAPKRSFRPPGPLEEAVRDRLAASGFHEAFNYAMIGPGDDVPFVTPDTPEAIPLANPLSDAMSVLRRAILPGLLRSAASNLRYGTADLRLFEVGRVFGATGGAGFPREDLRFAFVWAGAASAPHWSEPLRAVDAFDGAGLVEDVLALSGVAETRIDRSDLPGIHPGRGFRWRALDGGTLGWCGFVHPDVAARLDLPAAAVVAEVDLDAARAAAVAPGPYRPIPRLPAVTRDLSIVLDASVDAGSVRDRLAAVPAPAPARFRWIDRYAGGRLAAGEAAMTLRVILQPLERTLTDAETEGYRERLIATLETVDGARLRRIDT